jgi:hypothetical protein
MSSSAQMSFGGLNLDGKKATSSSEVKSEPESQP